jgi:predicted small metal-binding protein
MKRFVCSDIIPGCPEIFTGESDQSVLDQVIVHAAADHGLVKPPLALVELVVATTHPYTPPPKQRHLRLVGGGPETADDGAATNAPTASTRRRSASERPETEPALSQPDRSASARSEPDRSERATVVNLPAARNVQRVDNAAARFPVEQAQPVSQHPQYRHECLLYSSTDELLGQVVPFIRDGLRLGEPTIVAIAEPRQQALRDALGDDESRVVFADMAELANPARIIPAVRQFIAAHAGAPIRGVGEPIWAGRRSAEIVEAQLHEALMDVALAHDAPLWVLCPYNCSELDEATIDEAYRSHATAVQAQASIASLGYGGAAHAAAAFGSSLPDPQLVIQTVEARRDDPDEAAAAVLRFALGAGLPTSRAIRLVAGVSAISAAATRQTGQDVTIRLWGDAAEVVCEVGDRAVITDVMVGRSGLPGTQPHDQGIALANELCDLVQVRSNADGTTVRLHSWL